MIMVNTVSSTSSASLITLYLIIIASVAFIGYIVYKKTTINIKTIIIVSGISIVMFIGGTLSFNNSTPSIDKPNTQYSDFATPIFLEQTYSNSKTSVKDNKNYSITIDSVCIIEDEERYNYLVLKYSVTNLTNSKLEIGAAGIGPGSPSIEQNNNYLSPYFELSEKCKTAYGDIITDEHIPHFLRPHETASEIIIYKISDTQTPIRVCFSPVSYVIGKKYESSFVRDYSVPQTDFYMP